MATAVGGCLRPVFGPNILVHTFMLQRHNSRGAALNVQHMQHTDQSAFQSLSGSYTLVSFNCGISKNFTACVMKTPFYISYQSPQPLKCCNYKLHSLLTELKITPATAFAETHYSYIYFLLTNSLFASESN